MFDEIDQAADDPRRMFEIVTRQLVEAGELHGLFDLRLIQRRHELGLPPTTRALPTALSDELTSKLEHAYLDACREVGRLFLERSDPVSAWRYYRPTGERKPIRDWLARAVPDEDKADQLIELALHEGIDPERGYAWLVARRGTCQAISELEAMQALLPIDDQKACAAVLVRQLHTELISNLLSHLQQRGESVGEANSAQSLLTTWPQLTEDGHFHVDTSHLATTVRFARLLTEPTILEKVLDLAEYGLQLSDDYHYPGEPPFEKLYSSHRLLFRATLGYGVEEALEYFGNRAHQSTDDLQNTVSIETYLILLQRTGNSKRALDEYTSLVPKDCELSAHAPDLLTLAQETDCWQQYFDICQSRNDIVGFTLGKLAYGRNV